MEIKRVVCQCGASLKIPESMASVKTAKCPKCGVIVDLQPATAPAPVTPPAPVDSPIAPPDVKPCPFCGETIKATALKCRHCGEFLEASKAASAAKNQVPTPVSRSVDEPNPAEHFVAVVLPPVGLLIGLVWALKKQAKARRMLLTSTLSGVIFIVAGLLAKMYYFDAGDAGPSVAAGPPPAQAFMPSGDGEGGPPPQGIPPRGPREGMGAGSIDLEGQPPHIQRAMKANVRLEHPRGEGSGVVVQRKGDSITILTNRHVIDPSYQTNQGTPDLKTVPKLRVTYFNEQSNPGTVKWIAPDQLDLALVEAHAPKEIEAVSWTAAPKVLAGQEVFAVGNPIGLGWTYTRGVVSALRQNKANGREFGIIQTDAKLTYGNSGGGLYTSNGELIGINTAIADPRLGGGLGFAVRPQILIDLKPEGLELPK